MPWLKTVPGKTAPCESLERFAGLIADINNLGYQGEMTLFEWLLPMATPSFRPQEAIAETRLHLEFLCTLVDARLRFEDKEEDAVYGDSRTMFPSCAPHERQPMSHDEFVEVCVSAANEGSASELTNEERERALQNTWSHWTQALVYGVGPPPPKDKDADMDTDKNKDKDQRTDEGTDRDRVDHATALCAGMIWTWLFVKSVLDECTLVPPKTTAEWNAKADEMERLLRGLADGGNDDYPTDLMNTLKAVAMGMKVSTASQICEYISHKSVSGKASHAFYVDDVYGSRQCHRQFRAAINTARWRTVVNDKNHPLHPGILVIVFVMLLRRADVKPEDFVFHEVSLPFLDSPALFNVIGRDGGIRRPVIVHISGRYWVQEVNTVKVYRRKRRRQKRGRANATLKELVGYTPVPQGYQKRFTMYEAKNFAQAADIWNHLMNTNPAYRDDDGTVVFREGVPFEGFWPETAID